MRRLTTALLAMAAVAVTGLSGFALERRSGDEPPGRELLYLPNGKYLKIASLGQAPLLADLIYIWAIQFYGNYEREDRFLYVEHIFRNVIAELDPHYIDPYWLGALIMSVEARDLDGALRLLDQGFANNPQEWWLPFIAAWECYHAREYERAKSYFDVAAQVPGAPPAVGRMRAGMADRAGDLRGAIRLWTEVRDGPDSDAYSVAIAERQIRRLTVKADVQELQLAVERFREHNQRYPGSLAELVSESYIGRLPADPGGRPYRYDPSTGQVSSGEERVLGDR